MTKKYHPPTSRQNGTQWFGFRKHFSYQDEGKEVIEWYLKDLFFLGRECRKFVIERLPMRHKEPENAKEPGESVPTHSIARK